MRRAGRKRPALFIDDAKMPSAPAHEFLKTHSISGRTSSRLVKLLIQSLCEDGWIGAAIAVVRIGSEMYILDGHHRTVAARHAKIDVSYRLVEIDELSSFGYSSLEQVVHAHAEAGVNRLNLR